MKRHHYITSLVLLTVPVIVIYALTNYGTESVILAQEETMEIDPKLEYVCQKKQLTIKE